MNGWLWTAAAFGALGVLPFVLDWLASRNQPNAPDDYMRVITCGAILALCWLIAAILALIGLLVR